MKVLVPFGTRPEIVKLTPVIRALRAQHFEVWTVATGQQADAAMTTAFGCDLGMVPDEKWAPAGDDSERIGAIMALADRCVARVRPDLVIVLGDTFTVPVFCLAARRHRVRVAHVEAGLRSFGSSMEELDRRIASAAAHLHFAPTELAASFLRREGVAPRTIHVVGNPGLDELSLRGVHRCPVAERDGVVLTVHRPANVDRPERTARVVDLACRLAAEVAAVSFPVHPRTRDRLQATGDWARLAGSGVSLLPPLPYPAMLDLLARSLVVVTDSGGLQEEAAWLGVPAVVLRDSTPRWEGVIEGMAVLVGLDGELATTATARLSTPAEQRRVAAVPCPYGDGGASDRIAGILARPETRRLVESVLVG